MKPRELYEEWHSGDETGMRPKRIQSVRDDFAEIIGLTPPRRISEIEAWQESMKSHLSKRVNQLEEAVGDEEEPDAEDQ